MTVNSKLIEMDKFKEMMTAMVIHDLKNPLSSVIGLSNQPYSERNMQIIKQSGKQMLNLVMNILDVQKFETAQLKLHYENVILQDVIAKSIDNIKGLVDEKNLDIRVSGYVGLMVFIDASLVERVFTNILSNAIKYSENNAKINIHGETNPDSQFVKISITDFGPGISPEKLDRVFDKFAQINAKKTGSLRSTGIGLAFSKMVILAHQCKIGVESNPQKSTTFWFTLKKASLPDNNFPSPFIGLSEKKEIALDSLDIGYLEPFLTQIKKLKYYESGKLLSITTSLYEEFSPGVAQWKIEMENAIYSNNEFKFNELLKLTKPEISRN
jgi:signal transduction histidine kinase